MNQEHMTKQESEHGQTPEQLHDEAEQYRRYLERHERHCPT
jgi:hypothetical protein